LEASGTADALFICADQKDRPGGFQRRAPGKPPEAGGAKRRRVMKALIPETGVNTLRKEMDRLLDRFWDGDEAPVGAWVPRMDVIEAKDAFTVKAEVPGIEPKDIQVILENGVLTLRGEKRQEMEQKEDRFYRTERVYGTFSRSLRLPANVDAAKVVAEFKNGLLTVVMPKTAEARGLNIPIKV
jgi:HSP20 family protein